MIAHSPQRVLCYRRMDNGYFGHVIVEATPEGLEFSEQESGEVSWYRFSPSQEEREAVDLLLGWSCRIDDWALLINVTRLRQQTATARRCGRAA